MNAIIRLRRDNDYNYAKIADTFVPANGEICLVDTASKGLMAVCGDGVTAFSGLEYSNEIVILGYFFEGAFYKDSEHTELYNALSNRVYVDSEQGAFYYDGNEFVSLSGSLPTASAQTAGVMKLYDTTGDAIDGSMTQRSITENLNKKIEASLNAEEEELIISKLI